LSFKTFTPHKTDVIVAIVDYPMDDGRQTFQEPRMTRGMNGRVGDPPMLLGFHDGDIQVRWDRNKLENILDKNYEGCQVFSFLLNVKKSLKAPCLVIYGTGFNLRRMSSQRMYAGEATTLDVRKRSFVISQRLKENDEASTLPDLVGPIEVKSKSRFCIARAKQQLSNRKYPSFYPPLCSEWRGTEAPALLLPPKPPRELTARKTLYLPSNALLEYRPPFFWGTNALSIGNIRSLDIEIVRLNGTTLCMAEFNDGRCDGRGLQAPKERSLFPMCRTGSNQEDSIFPMCGCKNNRCSASAISSKYLASASLLIGDLFPYTKYKFRVRSTVYEDHSEGKNQQDVLLQDPTTASAWGLWTFFTTGHGTSPSTPPRPSVVSAGFFSIDFKIHRAAWNGIPIVAYIFELAVDTACDSLQNLVWNDIQAVRVPVNSSFEPFVLFKRGERLKGGLGPALVAGTSYFYRVAAVNARGEKSDYSNYKTNPSPATTGQILFPVLVIPNQTDVNMTTCLDILSGKPRCSNMETALTSFYDAIDMRYGLTGPRTYRWKTPVSFGREGAEVFAYNNSKITVDCNFHRCFVYCDSPLYTPDLRERCFPPSKLTGLTFRNAFATDDHGAVLRSIASVSPLQRRKTIITNCIFEDNIVVRGNGGSLFFDVKRVTAAVSIHNSLFRRNHAIGGSGGAITIDGTDLNLVSTIFESNNASIVTRNFNSSQSSFQTNSNSNSSRLRSIFVDKSGNGGAICILASSIGSVVTIQASIIRLNHADGLGGGIYVKESKFVVNLVDSSLFMMDSNTAKMGGQIYSETCELEWLNQGSRNTGIAANLLNGKASSFGGGIACIGSTMNVQRTVLAQNKATDGGGIYGILCMATLNAIELNRNEAERFGGGLYFSSLSRLLFAESSASSNIAQNLGGAIATDNCRSVNIFQSRIEQNVAAEGAGINFERILDQPIIETCEIMSNEARAGGGGGIRWSGTIFREIGVVFLENNIALYGPQRASDITGMTSSVQPSEIIYADNILPFFPEIQITVVDYYGHVVKRKNKATTVVATATSGSCLYRPDVCFDSSGEQKSSQSLSGKTVQEISGLVGYTNFSGLGIRGWPGNHSIIFEVIGIPPLKRSVNVEDCAEGTFLQIHGSGGTCTACPAGWSKNSTGIHSCSICHAGKFCLEASVWPTSCERGTFGPRPGLRECNECESGYFQNLVAQTTCIPCPKGYSQNSSRQVSCNECKRGTEGRSMAAIMCFDCREGSYQPDFGKDSCIVCPKGYAQNNISSHYCDSCLPGKYSSTTASKNCEVCEDGTVAVSSNAIQCVVCEIGKYANASEGCKFCEEGQFANKKKQTQCELCSKGKYAGNIGNSKCDECKPGFVSPSQGNSKCEECDGGQYSAFSGSFACTSCPAGKRTSEKPYTKCGK
jgi:hypothetical protein